MDMTVNDMVMAAAILLVMVFVAYVAMKQSDMTICSDITSLTEATAADLAMALKYTSIASANQVVKNFKFPDMFDVELTNEDITVIYTGPCPGNGEHTMEHNMKRIKEVSIVDSINKQRMSLCIKKYLENCEPIVTICLADEADCCVVEPSDCGGYSDGMTFIDTYTEKETWTGDATNTDDSDDDNKPNKYLVEEFVCFEYCLF